MSDYKKLIDMVVNYNESVKSKIGEIVRSMPHKKDLIKTWGLKQNEPHVIERDDVSDDEYEKIVSLINNMVEEDSYSRYKKYFDKLSSILGIKPSVILTYKHKKGEEDKNYIYFRYETKNKRVNIPNGYSLYHISPADNIKELEPKFKGKSPRNYFYSTPRVYCTINENMGKGYAQFKGKQKHIQPTKYKICENITSAILDDRIGNVFSGAVYIETNFPIKVKKISEVDETENVTESVDDVILSIYESYYFGDISSEERDMLLDIMQ